MRSEVTDADTAVALGSGGVEVTAEPTPGGTDRKLTFVVEALDDSGRVVATGEIDRAGVVRDEFLARVDDEYPLHRT